MQWRIAQNKLKLDLFDRRISVYEAAMKFLASVMTSGKANDEEIFKFMLATREAKWVLNTQVAEYLDKQLYQKANELKTLEAMLEGLPVGDERTSYVHKQREIKEWFLAQYDALDKHFASFLQLKH